VPVPAELAELLARETRFTRIDADLDQLRRALGAPSKPG